MLIKSNEVLTGMKVWIREKKFIHLFCCLLMLFKRNIYTDLPRTLSTFFPVLNWKTNLFFLKIGILFASGPEGCFIIPRSYSSRNYDFPWKSPYSAVQVVKIRRKSWSTEKTFGDYQKWYLLDLFVWSFSEDFLILQEPSQEDAYIWREDFYSSCQYGRG